MGDLFLLSERQIARISPFFPLSRGVPRVDDRRVVSGRTRRQVMGRTKRSTIASSAGAGSASSTASSPGSPADGPGLSAS